MKQEFKSCAQAIKWIMINATTEVDFQTLREELDFNHIFTGQFFVHICTTDRQVEIQIARS